MEKLLIVDDEPWILEGLKCQLDWEALGFSIITCRNGMEAADMIEKEHPSIVITDIRMPKMDGLELAEYIMGHEKECIVIITSGYSDFEYAQKAISYGVVSYLLKPIETDELEKSVLAALKKLQHIREVEAVKLQENMDEKNKRLSARYLESHEIVNGKEDTSKKIYVVVTQLFQDSSDNKFDLDFQKIIEGKCEGKTGILFFKNHHTNHQFVTIYEKRKEITDQQNLTDIRIEQEQWLTEIARDYSVTFSVGISKAIQTEKMIMDGYLHAKFIVDNCIPRGRVQVITQAQFEEKYSGIRINEEMLTELMNKTEYASAEELKHSYEIFIGDNLKGHDMLIQLRIALQEILIRTGELLQRYGCSIYHFENKYADIFHKVWLESSSEALKEQVFQLLLAVQDFIMEERITKKSSTIALIKRELEQNFSQSITLAETARKYYLNAAYLSRAFKKETGVNFNDYLKQVRMKKALELLMTTDLKIHEVALAVGYDNANYFLKKFREVYGMTPSRYKEVHEK